MRKSKGPSELGFTEHDKTRLYTAMQFVKDKRTFLRIKSVWLFSDGMKVSAIAAIVDKSRRTIYEWINCYLQHHQPAALQDEDKPGRPCSAPAITDKRIVAELKRNPLKLGYATNVWTVALLAKQLAHRYDCAIHPATLRRCMKKIGLRCKRPRYVYSEKDPNRAQKKGQSSES